MDQQETVGTSVRRANVFQNERGSSLFMEEVNCAWKGELQESYNVLSDPFGHPPDVSSIDIIPNVFSDFSAQGPNNQFLCVSTVGLEVSASCKKRRTMRTVCSRFEGVNSGLGTITVGATSSPQLNVGAAPVFSNDASHPASEDNVAPLWFETRYDAVIVDNCWDMFIS
ncbi:hypothetical protein Tco_0205611 [Tanacetum coccineum]